MNKNERSKLQDQIDKASIQVSDEAMSKLQLARQKALSELNHREPLPKEKTGFLSWHLTSTQLSAFSLCTIFTIGSFFYFNHRSESETESILLTNDLSILNEDLQLLEDLEFYQWMLEADPLDS